jgi:hypothetical protein
MTVTIGSLTFDHVSYEPAAVSDETPEGHVLRFNAQGEVIGLTIINAKWLLERDHVINVTVPERVAVSQDALADASSSTPAYGRTCAVPLQALAASIFDVMTRSRPSADTRTTA